MKKKILKILKLKRKLTRREKTLLTILGMVIVLLMVFIFVINPQHKRLQDLTQEKLEYEQRISKIKTILRREDQIYDQWDNLHKRQVLIMDKHFSHIDQPQIIYILNELFDSDGFDILDIKFDRPYQEEIGESTVNVMEIAIPYTSRYEEFLETIKRIAFYEKRILISDLIADRENEDLIVGDIYLKIYGLEGIDGIDKEITDVEMVLNEDKLSPFERFDDYINITDSSNDDDSKDEKLDENYDKDLTSSHKSPNNKVSNVSNVGLDNKNDAKNNKNDSDQKNDDLPGQEKDYENKLLEDFESEDFYFTYSDDSKKRRASRSTNSKSGKHSLRLEYNISNSQDKNKVLLDLKDRNITIKSAPHTMGIWIYSYSYSPTILGFQFRGQADEKIDIDLAKSVYWKGWRHLEIVPPQDRTLYPLQLEKIYLESSYNEKNHGVLLLDKLEATYSKEANKTDDCFDFYIVKKDDSLDKISMKVYGTIKKKNIIMKDNEIKNENEIKEGRILVISR